MSKLTYIGPHDEVEIADVGVVRRGQSIDVPDDLAGRPPVQLDDGDDGDEIDLGEGLLAQPDNWIPAGGLAVLTAKQLRAHAEERGIDLSDLPKSAKKAVIIAAINDRQED
jgi:hypothetical protein